MNEDRISLVSHLENSRSSSNNYKRAQYMNNSVQNSDIIVLLGVQLSDDFNPNISNKSKRVSMDEDVNIYI